MPDRETNQDRIVYPPPSSDPWTPNHIVNVILHPGERVRWIWTTGSGGGSFVSGYDLLRTWRRSPLVPHKRRLRRPRG